MARGRNAPALFDVIHAAKRPPKASPTGGGVPTPKHWSKGKPPADPTDDPTPTPEPATGTRRSWLAAARQAAPEATSRPVVPPTERPAALDPLHEEPSDEEPSDREQSDGGQPDGGQLDREQPGRADGPGLPHASSGVVITRLYPPEVTQRPSPAVDHDDQAGEVEDAAAAHEDVEEGTADGPPVVVVKPVVARPADDEKPTWSARRAKVVAERQAAGGTSDPSFDPTADVSPADLRSPRRSAKSAAVDDQPAARPSPRRPSAASPSSASAGGSAGDSLVAVDHSAGEVRLRLSYGGAVLAAVILLLVLAIAYLAGQRSGTAESAADVNGVGRSTLARGPSSTDAAHLMAAATSPSVTTSSVMPPLVAPASAEVPTAAARVAVPPLPPAPVAPMAAADPVADPPARQVGMLYVVMLSYDDRQSAKRAAAFLNRNGVPCDVVAGPTGYAMRDWSSVVGTQPIAPRDAHSKAVQDHLQAIVALGQKFSSKTYNQFDPRLYTWKADSDVPRP